MIYSNDLHITQYFHQQLDEIHWQYSKRGKRIYHSCYANGATGWNDYRAYCPHCKKQPSIEFIEAVRNEIR